LNLQRRSYASAFRRLRLACAPEEGLLQKDYRAQLASGSATAKADDTAGAKPARPSGACP